MTEPISIDEEVVSMEKEVAERTAHALPSCTHQWIYVRKLTGFSDHCGTCGRGHNKDEHSIRWADESRSGVLVQCPSCYEVRELWGER